MANQKDNQRQPQTLVKGPVSDSKCESELSFRERCQLYHTNSRGQRIDTTASHERPSTRSTHLAPQSAGTSVSTPREAALYARLSQHDPAQRVSAENQPDLPDVTARAHVSTRNAIFDQQRRQYEARKQEAAERAAARAIRLAIECAHTRTISERSQVRRNSMEKVIKSFDMVEKEDDKDDVLSAQ
ncbi:hypothetical protein LTS08_000513 [Lithohypha guttulata]|nr:hypothetical protein LTS08_000513 [Lithohypha guttulata]